MMESAKENAGYDPANVGVVLERGNAAVRLDDPGDEIVLTDRRLVVKDRPNSLSAEQFRILYTKMVPGSLDRPSYTLAVTSAVKEEGKTFTAFNLAVSIARDFDQKVLLLEGDFKKPTFHTYLKEGQGLGLLEVLEGRSTPESCWISLCHGRLRILQAGKISEQSSRLLASGAMTALVQQMREQFRYIVLDAPPILPTADMNIFSHWVDGILLVVRAGRTPRSMVKRAMASLASEKIIGAVLNGIEPKASRYFYGTHYKE